MLQRPQVAAGAVHVAAYEVVAPARSLDLLDPLQRLGRVLDYGAVLLVLLRAVLHDDPVANVRDGVGQVADNLRGVVAQEVFVGP